jgi:ACS family glucarate transporter-like MFS transporter
MNLLKLRIRWLLIFWMFAVSAIGYLDRVNISIAGSSIERDFHLTNVQLGWVFSAFVLGYAFFQAPAGRLADRYGPRKVLAFGTVWWGIFTCLTALVPAGVTGVLFILITVRFVLGAGEAVIYPASNRLVANWIPSAERGVANGWIFAGVGAGAGISPPLVAYILAHHGWRASFWICATLGLAAGLIWLWLARDTPKEHAWVTAEEETHIANGLPRNLPGGPAVLSWRAIFQSWDVVLMTFSYFCFVYAAYIFFSWFFIYLSTVRGLDLKSSSYYGMLPFLAMATCSPVGGWLSDRLTKRFGRRTGRCGVAVVSMAVAAVFIGLGMLARDARLATVVLAGGAGALYISQSSFWSVSADIAGRSAGFVSGVMNMGGQLGGAVTASLTPLIANHLGWSASFLVAAGLCVLGSIAWLGVNPGVNLEAFGTMPTSGVLENRVGSDLAPSGS